MTVQSCPRFTLPFWYLGNHPRLVSILDRNQPLSLCPFEELFGADRAGKMVTMLGTVYGAAPKELSEELLLDYP